MENTFWWIFVAITALKLLLMPAYYSTDFEVHRNWLAITHSLPMSEWYTSNISEWTLDYPPFFAYFEWLLSQVARFVDPAMLKVDNLNYASAATIYFQRISVIAVDLIFALGVLRCLKALGIKKATQQHFAGQLLLLCNVGLIYVDHIHFQYNGMLFGILLFSISFLLEERPLMAAFTFAALLNFKHIFLYMAPAYGVYLLKFYCFDCKHNALASMAKLLVVGLTPFVAAFGPFWRQLPEVLARLFPFKRGLTHVYWAPNFWAIYNSVDKFAVLALGRNDSERTVIRSTTSGIVQEIDHEFLPTVKPLATFVLCLTFMLPILVKLFAFTPKSESKLVFLRSLVLCSCASFMFGWHVHEKAILMCLIPLCLLCLVNNTDAKYAFLLSLSGYWCLIPLLFHIDLVFIRYTLYLTYVVAMYGQIERIFGNVWQWNWLELLYMVGFAGLPLYEHLISPLWGLDKKLPFMPLLLTSLYCALGVSYFFIRYYLYALTTKPIAQKLLISETTPPVTANKPPPKPKLKTK